MSGSLKIRDFRFGAVSGPVINPIAPLPSPLGPLEDLVGTWTGTGFNQIWRPLHGPQDHFLELNETTETLQFVEIPGDIPNRGFLQGYINLHGLTYLQTINDAIVQQGGGPVGLHLEPGLWLYVPATDNPHDPDTVARLANIPHGTALVAQGTASVLDGPPQFPIANIVPFQGTANNPGALVHFPEEDLGIPTSFRTPLTDIPHVTQGMATDPNAFLQQGIAGKSITRTTELKISTADLNPPSSGGGTSNIAFLKGGPVGPNAEAVRVDATFWIEEYAEGDLTLLQLQYTQTVILKFDGLNWPHVSVATLRK